MRIEWRCTSCKKLLGICQGSQLHISYTRGHEYLVGLPAIGTCRNCHTLNQCPAPDPAPAQGPAHPR